MEKKQAALNIETHKLLKDIISERRLDGKAANIASVVHEAVKALHKKELKK